MYEEGRGGEGRGATAQVEGLGGRGSAVYEEGRHGEGGGVGAFHMKRGSVGIVGIVGVSLVGLVALW